MIEINKKNLDIWFNIVDKVKKGVENLEDLKLESDEIKVLHKMITQIHERTTFKITI